VQAQLDARAAPHYAHDHGMQRMPVVGVVGMEHPLRAVAGHDGEIDVGVDNARAEDVALERERRGDVLDQQVDGQRHERAPVVRSRHPGIARSLLHRCSRLRDSMIALLRPVDTPARGAAIPGDPPPPVIVTPTGGAPNSGLHLPEEE
jgi:hypothetical protein